MVEHGHIVGEVRLVDVGADGVDMRCGGVPDVQHIVGRAARFVGFRPLGRDRVAQGRIDVHRKRELRLAGGGDRIDIVRHRPGVKDLVGVGAEHLAPGAGSQPPRLDERGRHWPIESFLRQGRIVAHAAPGASLVLDLDHDHRMLRIGAPDVGHQGGKGPGVGGLGSGAQR